MRPQNRVRPSGSLPRLSPQKQVRSPRCTGLPGGLAESGTPQNWVRHRVFGASTEFTQIRVRLTPPDHADLGTRWRDAQIAGFGTVPKSAGISCQNGLRRGSARPFRRSGAETGTLRCGESVEQPVGSVTYPRRFRYGVSAETGSGIRRFGFAVAQNRVRKHAETGSVRGEKRFAINGLAAPYTVYE